MICQIRKRTEPEDIAYSLYLYSLDLSLRNTSKAICRFVKRSHTAIRDWIQKYTPKISCSKTIYIAEFIIDETQSKVGSEYIWLWVAIENNNRQVRQLNISKERNMFVCSRTFSIQPCDSIWRTSSFNGRRQLVSTSM
jgi:putative transposase